MKSGILTLIVVGVVIGVIVYLLTRKEGLVESIVPPVWERVVSINRPKGFGWKRAMVGRGTLPNTWYRKIPV